MLDRLHNLNHDQFFQACAMQRFSQLCGLSSVGEGRVFRARTQETVFSGLAASIGGTSFLPPAIRHYGTPFRSTFLAYSSI